MPAQVIVCDNCDMAYTFDGRNKRFPLGVSATIRAEAEDAGWLCDPPVDLCPVCRYTDAANKVISSKVARALKREDKPYTVTFNVSGLSTGEAYERVKYYTRKSS